MHGLNDDEHVPSYRLTQFDSNHAVSLALSGKVLGTHGRRQRSCRGSRAVLFQATAVGLIAPGAGGLPGHLRNVSLTDPLVGTASRHIGKRGPAQTNAP